MEIDIRNVRCRWVNLDNAEENSRKMEEQFKQIGLKNHERLSARVIEPPPETPKTIHHYRGCAQSHIDILESEKETPLLILEDDAKTTDWFNPFIPNIPDNTDAIYLGISHGDGRYFAQDIGHSLAKISGVFATHAIMYLTEDYKKAVIETAKDFVYNKNTPFDLGCAMLQQHFNVITTHLPFFYQADERSSANKWENLTRQPLRMMAQNAGALGPGYGEGPQGV
jgi:hypothetical protein